MEELSIKEKAKRYDEAIEKAKEYYNKGRVPEFANYITSDIFPELKKKTDEEMIQKLIAVCHLYYGEGEDVERDECLEWLEKQSNKDSQTTLPTFTFDDVLALQCCMETVKKVQGDNELYEQLQSLHDRLHNAYWLEKQGEQSSLQVNERAWLYLVSDVLTWKDGIGQYLDDPRVQELAKKLCSEYTQKLYNSVQDVPFEQKPTDKIQLGKKYKCIASPRYSTFMTGKIYKPEDKFLCSFINLCSDCFELIEDSNTKFKVSDYI